MHRVSPAKKIPTQAMGPKKISCKLKIPLPHPTPHYFSNGGSLIELGSIITAAYLRCKHNGRRNGGGEVDGSSTTEGKDFDIEEGAKYVLKEFAFLLSLSNIYERYERFVYVYHRSWPVLEKYLGGHYDNEVKSSLGFVIFE